MIPDEYEAGSFEDMTRLYRVPFMVYANEYAKHHRILQQSDEDLLFSAPFLGAYVMELMGFAKISPFWDFNMELRRQFPVMTETRSFAPCRTASSYMNEEQRAPLLLYRDWSYFKVFHDR
jgi:hypothetical protein